MISLVVPTLDTLRQWLDDLGMNFFECDTCQALHLPHMQNFDGVYDAKIDLVDNTVLFFPRWRRSGLPRCCRWRPISLLLTPVR